jgi:ABC-type dipeptide/oligopeptide/nickel transport system ATPase subunit
MSNSLHFTPFSTVAVHASAVRADGGALIFLGPSGTGKTTMCHLLSGLFEELAQDTVYLILRTGVWEVAKGDAIFHGIPLTEEKAATLEGVPLQAVFRLYQAPATRLKPIDALHTCRYLTDALFEIVRQREDDLATKRLAFANAAAIARSVPGYQFYFDLSSQTLEALNNEINWW